MRSPRWCDLSRYATVSPNRAQLMATVEHRWLTGKHSRDDRKRATLPSSTRAPHRAHGVPAAVGGAAPDAPDSVMDVSSEVYQTVAKLQRKIKEQEKEIARVNAAEDKRRQNMQNSTSFQGWKEINDRARADNNTQDIAYAQLKKEAGAEAVSFEDNIFARRKTVPQMLWKTEKPQVTMHASLEECCAMSDTARLLFFCQTRNPSRMKPRTVTAPNLTAATRRPTIRIDPRSAWIL